MRRGWGGEEGISEGVHAAVCGTQRQVEDDVGPTLGKVGGAIPGRITLGLDKG